MFLGTNVPAEVISFHFESVDGKKSYALVSIVGVYDETEGYSLKITHVVCIPII